MYGYEAGAVAGSGAKSASQRLRERTVRVSAIVTALSRVS